MLTDTSLWPLGHAGGEFDPDLGEGGTLSGYTANASPAVVSPSKGRCFAATVSSAGGSSDSSSSGEEV